MSDRNSYTLWRGTRETDDGAIVADTLVIILGEHGAAHVSQESKPLESGDKQKKIAELNLNEMKRVIEEGRKWEMRLKESPLGKTQQDFVAYYTEVIGLFREWCRNEGVPFPQ